MVYKLTLCHNVGADAFVVADSFAVEFANAFAAADADADADADAITCSLNLYMNRGA